MAKVQVTAEFDLPEEILREYEVVAVRAPFTNEVYFWGGRTHMCNQINHSDDVRVILRKKFQWPAGFEGVAAMARNNVGELYAFDCVPIPSGKVNKGWDGETFESRSFNIRDWAFPQLCKDFPKPSDHGESLRINPNFQPK